MSLQVFLPKLCSAEQDQAIYRELSAQAKLMAQHDGEGSAVLELLHNLLT